MSDDVLELVPAAPASETAAVAEAAARAQLALAPAHEAYGDAWRLAALREGVERAPGNAGRAER